MKNNLYRVRIFFIGVLNLVRVYIFYFIYYTISNIKSHIFEDQFFVVMYPKHFSGLRIFQLRKLKEFDKAHDPKLHKQAKELKKQIAQLTIYKTKYRFK